MAKKSNTKGKIISAAWQLFYKQGYDETTIDEIVEESGTSKGSFYHYFDGKDSLLSSLSYLFDEKYEALSKTLDPDMTCEEKLMYLNQELFIMVENSISIDLLAKCYSSQLVTASERHLLDQSRTYYKLLRQIAIEGQEKGELNPNVTVNEVIKAYALFERGLLYDWCVCNGDYSLYQYSSKILPMFLKGLLK